MSRHNRRRTRGGHHSSSSSSSKTSSLHFLSSSSGNYSTTATPTPSLSMFTHPGLLHYPTTPPPGLLYISPSSSSSQASQHSHRSHPHPTLSRQSYTSPRSNYTRYLSAQAFERQKRSEAESAVRQRTSDKARVFGLGFGANPCGEVYDTDADADAMETTTSGEDDEALCVKMMEYFEGLDWVGL